MKPILRIFASVLIIGAFLAPQASSAVTVEELQAQINSLLATIASLQTQLNQLNSSPMAESTLPTPSTSCMEFKRNLRIGDSGDDVKKMQDILVKAGYKPDTDGKYGKKTAAAVSAFQETFSAEILYPLRLQNGTGFFGTATRTKFNQLYGCGGTSILSPTLLYPSATVCAQPPWTCPAGRACPAVMPAPTTYANEEAAKNAGATVLYKGMCVSPYITSPAGSLFLSTGGGLSVVAGQSTEIQAFYSPPPIPCVTNTSGYVTSCSNSPITVVTAEWTLSNSVVSVGNKVGDPTTAVVKGLAVGTGEIKAIYKDSSGNVLTAKVVVTVTTTSIIPTPVTLTGITPSSGPVGTKITLYGCGSESTLGYNVIYSGPVSGSMKIPVVSVPGGCGYMTFDVPSNFPAGAYTLSVKNNSTGQTSTSVGVGKASVAFTVTAPVGTVTAIPVTLTGITPSSGPVSTKITLYGCGSESALGYNLVYGGPASGSIKIPVVSIPGGCGYMTIDVPSNFPAGTYTLSVKNNSTGQVSTSVGVGKDSMLFTVVGALAPTNPAITYLAPSSGAPGAGVWIYGSGFSASGNQVLYRDATGTTGTVASGVSSNGTSIYVTAPNPAANGAYYVKVINGNGLSSNEMTFTITAPAAPAPTISISANSTTVVSGGSATITWSSSNATVCTAYRNGAYYGSKPTSGSESYVVTQTDTWRLDCTGEEGAGSASVTVTVPTNPAITYLAPSSGAPGAGVWIYGSGFSASGNQVLYRDATGTTGTVASGVSSNGTSIYVTAPNPAANGAYYVKVINGNGLSSNEMTFTIINNTSAVLSTHQLASALTAMMELLESMLKTISR
ncbi:MAG: peptidoglycan-binding protein [Patescibacteria group bacterium]